MLKKYLVVAFRNILRNRVFSFINIAGLSISLALVIIIAAYAQFELSVNKFDRNYNRIYKVGSGLTPAPVAGIVKSNVPEIKRATRIQSFNFTSATMKYGSKVMTVKNIILADPDFFDIFTFPARMGNPEQAMTQPMGLVLTESEAKTIFGSEDPINKVVRLNNAFDLTVKAVIKDIPQNSSMQFSGAISFISLKQMGAKNLDNWVNSNYETYVLFPRKSNRHELSAMIESVLKKSMPQYQREHLNTTLYPFKDIYYNPELSGFNEHGSAGKDLALISIAILVLLIAVINYVNLSTARVSARSKEVGVRKTVGASRSNLIVQFLGESMLMGVVSMTGAVLFALVLIELFGGLIGVRLSVLPNHVASRCMIYLAFGLLLGLLSGVYPALYLTSFRPSSILKGNSRGGQGRASPRKILIVFQFSITIFLIICTLAIYEQMRYVRNKPLGFHKEDIIYFPVNPEIQPERGVVATKILQLPFVKDFSYSSAVPGNMGMTWGMPLKYQGRDSSVDFFSAPAASGYIKLMGMKIIEGRDFIARDSNDIGNVIINQAFAAKYGLTKPLSASLVGFGQDKGKIVGVVENFNFQSLYSRVQPLALFNYPAWTSYGLIRLKSTGYLDIKSVISGLRSIWKNTSPDFPMKYNFLDQSLERQYNAENRFERAFFAFSLFAIFIACLGLFGLTAYTVEQRTKEISVRKILGASTAGITLMLSGQYIILLLGANVIAWPAAYYVTHDWLSDFAYRIGLSPWFFILAGALAVLVALLTVSTHAIRAATANPVESLRYE